jgi:uncharacterized protein YecE (DUF72 family)
VIWSLGTQGWSYADWAGTMYDAATRPEAYLRSYAEEFRSVEIDSTFYGTPTVERVRKWAASVPEGFSFSCKLPREITHERRMLGSKGLIAEFYDAVRAFGPKLGCVLVQFEASYTRDEEPVFRDVLDAFPRDVRTAFEFRDPAWYTPDVQAYLEERGHALAVADAPFVPRELMGDVLRRTTVPFAYVRLIGVHDALERFDVVRIPRESDRRSDAASRARVRLREQSLSRPQPRNGPRTLRSTGRPARAPEAHHAADAVLAGRRRGAARVASEKIDDALRRRVAEESREVLGGCRGYGGAAREEVVFISSERGVDVVGRCDERARELPAVKHGEVRPFA